MYTYALHVNIASQPHAGTFGVPKRLGGTDLNSWNPGAQPKTCGSQ